MTPTDPDLVTRLRAFIDWRNANAAQPYQDLLTEALAALDAAHQKEAGWLIAMAACDSELQRLGAAEARVQQLQTELDTARQRDAELEAGALELSGALNKALTRERQLCDQLDTAEARVQQLEAALKELAHRWRAESEAIASEDDDASLKRFGTQMDPDGYISTTVTLDTCADELENTVAVGRVDTPEPPHED